MVCSPISSRWRVALVDQVLCSYHHSTAPNHLTYIAFCAGAMGVSLLLIERAFGGVTTKQVQSSQHAACLGELTRVVHWR